MIDDISSTRPRKIPRTRPKTKMMPITISSAFITLINLYGVAPNVTAALVTSPLNRWYLEAKYLKHLMNQEGELTEPNMEGQGFSLPPGMICVCIPEDPYDINRFYYFGAVAMIMSIRKRGRSRAQPP
jgi:hypothetical protein